MSSDVGAPLTVNSSLFRASGSWPVVKEACPLSWCSPPSSMVTTVYSYEVSGRSLSKGTRWSLAADSVAIVRNVPTAEFPYSTATLASLSNEIFTSAMRLLSESNAAEVCITFGTGTGVKAGTVSEFVQETTDNIIAATSMATMPDMTTKDDLFVGVLLIVFHVGKLAAITRQQSEYYHKF